MATKPVGVTTATGGATGSGVTAAGSASLKAKPEVERLWKCNYTCRGRLAVLCDVTWITASFFLFTTLSACNHHEAVHISSPLASSFFASSKIYLYLHFYLCMRCPSGSGRPHIWTRVLAGFSYCHAWDVCSSQTVAMTSSITLSWLLFKHMLLGLQTNTTLRGATVIDMSSAGAAVVDMTSVGARGGPQAMPKVMMSLCPKRLSVLFHGFTLIIILTIKLCFLHYC